MEQSNINTLCADFYLTDLKIYDKATLSIKRMIGSFIEHDQSYWLIQNSCCFPANGIDELLLMLFLFRYPAYIYQLLKEMNLFTSFQL